MKEFMDKDFLLDTEAARILFHKYAENEPIIDYHCHIDPKDIYEDKQYKNITELWLGGDHYKWRLMRQWGYDEEAVTGRSDDWLKFLAWTDTLSRSVGSPLYHWSHLELQRYFDCCLPICPKNAKAIYDRCNEVLASGKLNARNIIKASKVRVIGTTDDPCDTLEWHKKLAEDETFNYCIVIPTFRPDQLLLIGSETFPAYIARLSQAGGKQIDSFDSLKTVLTARMEYFNSLGCRSSDQSTAYFPCTLIGAEEADRVLKKALAGEALTEHERLGFMTEIMLFLGAEYARLGWVMQLHFGVARNTSTRMFNLIGKDTGFDRIDSNAPIETLAAFLNELDKTGSLPKTVLYSLDPTMNTAIDVLAKCFNETGICGKVQHGAAWWFNDNIGGMRDHLRSLCEQGVLGAFIGMLTDSRCMLSYTRHEYFRRILCQFLGRLVDDGELYWDEEILGSIVRNVSFGNALRFFGLLPPERN